MIQKYKLPYSASRFIFASADAQLSGGAKRASQNQDSCIKAKLSPHE